MKSLPPPLPRKRRGVQVRLLITTGLLAVVLVLGVLHRIVTADEPPSNIDDFDAPPRIVADADNAYLILRDAALALPALPLLTTGEAAPKLATIIDGEIPLSLDEIDHLLAPYSDLWDALDAADRAPDTRPPRLDNLLDTIPETANLRLIVELALLRALREARQGDTSAALVHAKQALRLSRKLEASRNTILQLLLGHALASESLACIREIGDHATDPALLKSTTDEISRQRSEPEFTEAALRHEARVVGRLLGSTDELKTVLELDSRHDTPLARHLARLLYKPNQTQRIYADHMRACIGQLDQPWTVIRERKPFRELEKFTTAPLPGSLLNKGGRIALNIITPQTTAIFSLRLATEANLELTRLYLALRAYHLEHDERLPQALDALVPDYLPTIPRDPFDGEPLRYSPELFATWSIGPENKSVTHADDPLPAKLPASRLDFARPTPTSLTEPGSE